jgi:putative hemolysin
MMKNKTLLILSLIVISAILIAGCTQQTANPAGTPTPAATQAAVGMANPASVACGQAGGTLDIKKDASGNEYGMCTFKNGTSCEEWALFRGEGCKPGLTTTISGGTPKGTTSAPATGSGISGSALFGGLSYNWVEYKMSTGSGSDAMTVYYKYNQQTGKCSMRFEGAGAQQMQGMPGEMDCSSKGTPTNDPNKVSSDAQITCSPLDESVTVPAGTFTATKCTITSKDGSATTWVVRNKFMVKMQSSSPQGSVEMVLNTYG